MDLDEGAMRDRDPEKIAVSGALCACSGAACRARGERKRWGQRVSERERGREDRATDRERVRACGRAGAGRLGVGGLRLARWWAALGAGWAGWPGWRLGLFLLFF